MASEEKRKRESEIAAAIKKSHLNAPSRRQSHNSQWAHAPSRFSVLFMIFGL
jgi:hypothetical protein